MLCYLQTKESFASENDHSCPQMTLPHMRNTSLWSEFVRSADFINVDESEAIQELVSQTAELKAIFNHFKELYVSYYFIKLQAYWKIKTTGPAQRGYGDWSVMPEPWGPGGPNRYYWPPHKLFYLLESLPHQVLVDTLPLFQSRDGG